MAAHTAHDRTREVALKVRLLQDWNIKCDGLELDAFPRALFEKGSKVKELILSKNRIPTVPPEVSQLCSLRTLKLDCNAITHIPPEIGMLSELQLLDLSSNNLAAVPLELGTLYMLKYVNLLDNPLQGATPSGREFYEAYYGKSSTAAAAEAKRFGMGESTAGELATVNSMNSTKSPGSTAHVRTYTKQLLACLRSEMGPELKELFQQRKVKMRRAFLKEEMSKAVSSASLPKIQSLLIEAEKMGVHQESWAVKGEKAACCLFELELCAQEQPKDLGRLQAALDAWDSIVGAAAAGWASPNYIAVRLALRKLQKEQGAAANKQRAASAPRWKGPAAGQQDLDLSYVQGMQGRQHAGWAVREGSEAFDRWLADKQHQQRVERERLNVIAELERLGQAERMLQAEEERRVMKERERAWPERIRIPPPTPSFNQRVQEEEAAAASMRTRPSSAVLSLSQISLSATSPPNGLSPSASLNSTNYAAMLRQSRQQLQLRLLSTTSSSSRVHRALPGP
mmetsp:Transcript_9489/g.25580  ORF Transcript_9489/g.25580 Transcript_9489/m.25580 type:complete len:511 (-) Transcript_9489:150-1682(-)